MSLIAGKLGFVLDLSVGLLRLWVRLLDRLLNTRLAGVVVWALLQVQKSGKKE